MVRLLFANTIANSLAGRMLNSRIGLLKRISVIIFLALAVTVALLQESYARLHAIMISETGNNHSGNENEIIIAEA
jgi:hypothetical protein